MLRLGLPLVLVADIAFASDVSLRIDPEPGDVEPIRWQVEQILREPGKEFDGGVRDQAFSLLGREDLIAQKSRAYAGQMCEPGAAAADPLAAIVSAARRHRVVIINEAHDWSAHRAFIADVARALARDGFGTYAAETFRIEPGREPLPYLRDDEGYYSREATYGRLARTVLALGYKLLPYEQKLTFASEEEKAAYRELPSSERIARREEEQANNLIARFFDRNKEAKILIHVGYSHAREVPQTRKDSESTLVWMATRLKQKTGIDPLTIDQTFCRGSSGKIRLGAEPEHPQLPPGSFDLYVDHPLPEFEYGRPKWRQQRGDIPTAIPAELMPDEGWAVIEARRVDEPDEAVPIDRVAVRAGETHVRLMLPPGQYRVRAVLPPQAE